MLRWALSILLFAAPAFGQGLSSYYSLGEDDDNGDLLWLGNPYPDLSAPPLFSFASPTAYYDVATGSYYAAYAGLPATDGCYAPASVTGTKGEALTFTRASTRFCPTSANEATGVMCASGEVCITSSGTTRGISIFRAGTNSCLRSQEFNDAVWASNNSGVAAPTVTANASVAPDGTTTADRIQIPAVTGVQYSQLYQLSACPAGTQNASVWVKGNGASGDFHLKLGTACAICAYTNGVWTRCAPGIAAAGSLTLAIANDGTSSCGANDAVDAFIWGAQCESGTYATPYVATTSASATRNIEVATFANVLPTASFADKYSAAVSWLVPPVLIGVATQTPLLAYGTNGMFEMQQNGATHRVYHYPSSANVSDGTVSTSTLSRLSGYADGTNKAACLDGVCSTAAGSGSFAGGPWTVYAGTELGGAGTGADGLLSNVCIDPSSTRCR